MMKHEFDSLVGIDTDPECYKKIEAVYMKFDEMFPTKESIAAFYKKHDMNGIERMYREMLKIQQLEQRLKAATFPRWKNLSISNEKAYEFLMNLNDWDIFGEIRRDGFAYTYDDMEGCFSERNLKTGEFSNEDLTPLQLYLKLFHTQDKMDAWRNEYKNESLGHMENQPSEEPTGEKMTLEECPVGLFKWNGILVLKTEYRDDVGRCECYTIDGGERFWGGGALNLNQIFVQPVKL